jgi:hypothetical protein
MRTVPAQAHELADIDGNCADMGYFFRLISTSDVLFVDEPLAEVRVHDGMESSQAGFFRFNGRRRSEVLPLAPLEFATKDRYLRTELAAQALGEDRWKLRQVAAKQAASLLLADARNSSLVPKDRFHLARHALGLLPAATGLTRRS